MNVVTESLKLLGTVMRDKVTGFEGMVSTVGFDAYGCVQILVTPTTLKKEGGTQESHWFDVKRLESLDKTIMPAPFDCPVEMGKEPGPAEKPAMPNGPR